MLFTSAKFLLFIILAGVVQYLLPVRFRWIWLLVCSSFFYLTVLPAYFLLFVALTVLNYLLGIAIEKGGIQRPGIYLGSIAINLAVLVFFKYFGILEGIFKDIAEAYSGDKVLSIILPVGLSFFIFSSLSYLIEVKRGNVAAMRHFGVFASGMLFFPKMLQGPIERPGTLFPQFVAPAKLNYSQISEGAKLILWGYFKKLVVAERLAIYVDAVYGNYEHHNGVTLIFATLIYSVQIYADFSGYTDIALGSAKILGINLTNNFKRPYFASTVKEFWNRWHISFSTWLRDYLFLPMAYFFAGKITRPGWLGIPKERWVFFLAVNITFIICGLWHGEGANFLIWGLLFGVFQTVANWTSGISKSIRKSLHISKKSRLNKVFNILVTFALVSFAWIFFRAESASEAFIIIERMFTVSGGVFLNYQTLAHGLFGVLILFLVDYAGERNGAGNLPLKAKHWLSEIFIYAGLVMLILLTGVLDGAQFIYFQF